MEEERGASHPIELHHVALHMGRYLHLLHTLPLHLQQHVVTLLPVCGKAHVTLLFCHPVSALQPVAAVALFGGHAHSCPLQHLGEWDAMTAQAHGFRFVHHPPAPLLLLG